MSKKERNPHPERAGLFIGEEFYHEPHEPTRTKRAERFTTIIFVVEI